MVKAAPDKPTHAVKFSVMPEVHTFKQAEPPAAVAITTSVQREDEARL